MVRIRYDAQLHRLRIEGACEDTDHDAVAEAVATHGDEADHLTIDLVSTTHLDASVAATIVEARDRAREEGRRISVIRRRDSEADLRIVEAEHDAATAPTPAHRSR